MTETRGKFMDAMKASMKAGDAARTSTIRMMMAKLKDADIAARPKDALDETSVIGLLRGMVKSRREAIALYEQGNRPELVAKESAEIAVITGFLPQAMDDDALRAAVLEAIAESGATTAKDTGKVMAALKAKHGSQLDMGRANPLVRAALAGG